ncbi:hypothetical protein PINS_up016318 [Pythium insidiosum]|nr:hypothetical protein PINS_up016318 [Pythium insidiosum]
MPRKTTNTPAGAQAPRRSSRIKDLAPVSYVFSKPRQPKEYPVYSIYDRHEPSWYWIRWFGYKEEDDTVQRRDFLEEKGFGDLCDYVDAFKDWEAEAEEGEERTFKMFLKVKKIPRTFTADDNERCYVASLRRASELLGVPDYLPDVVVDRFLSLRPEVDERGITWKDLTKLMQLSNSLLKKKSGVGVRFPAKRSKANLIRRTVSGRIDLEDLVMSPGVYLCGVATGNAGHMFVLQKFDTGIVRVHDSIDHRSQLYEDADFGWVIRWVFMIQCVIGHF